MPSYRVQQVPHGVWLGIWILIGASLRFTNLDAKPPWSDEWATLVFSLGNSFRSIPINQVISLETLTQPWRVDAPTVAGDVITRLATESTHPPLYFLLTHWWLKTFSPSNGLVSLWWGRSLSALFGVVAIPALFALGWLTFRSRTIAQLAAALMAVSPFGVYLAQEARHYTLAILWIIASLACLVTAVRAIRQQVRLPIPILWGWMIVNTLGTATHYFFAVTLMAEGIVLLGFWVLEYRTHAGWKGVLSDHWQRIYLGMIGTLGGSGIWLVAWQQIPENRLTEWIQQQGNPLIEIVGPLARQVFWGVSMVFLLPVEGVALPIAVLSGIGLLVALGTLIPTYVQTICQQMPQAGFRLGVQAIGGVVLGAIALILGVTYGLGKDLTLAARYQFIYFPALLLLVATALTTKRLIQVTLALSLVGALTVVLNLGYQKPDRPDLLVPVMLEVQRQHSPQHPMLIATVQKTHEQIGELMNVAWELKQRVPNLSSDQAPRFLLAHKEQDAQVATQTLQRAIAQFPRPFDLWLLNFSAPQAVESQNCFLVPEYKRKVSGYHYRLYRCHKLRLS
jgi:uncharacterized membrane protein